MRVLWLAKGLGPGGAENLMLAVARAADRTRVEYEAAYLLPWKQQLVHDLEQADVATHLLDGPREADMRWAGRLRKLVVDRGIDVVHSQSPLPASIARIALSAMPRSTRPRLVHTEHNVWHSYRRSTRALARATWRLDDARVAVAEAVRTSLPAAMQARTETLVHGVDLARVRSARSDRSSVRADLGIGDDEILVLTVANLRADKDYPNVLDAAATVLHQRGNVHWLAAGQGPLEAALRIEVDKPGFERFRLLGHRTDVWPLLAAADLLVVGSKAEGLPVVVMEALAMGTAIVATRVGGIPDLVRDGIEGRVVEPGRPEALAQAVLALIDDDAARSSAAEAAAARADLVDVRRAVQRLEAIYESI